MDDEHPISAEAAPPLFGAPADPTAADADDAPDAPDAAEVDAANATAPPKPRRSTVKSTIEWVVLIAAALIIALVVKAFLFQAFYIPSDSMVPTLKKNDRVIVNKLSYRMHAVHRGDIVVFTAPKGPDGQPIDPTIKDLVKRVIALPGEIVGEKDGKIVINGKTLDEKYLPAGTVTDCAAFKPVCFPTTPIPAGSYWVMGDNRAGSRDSRYFGPIKKSSIVGRVFVRVWPPTRLHIF